MQGKHIKWILWGVTFDKLTDVHLIETFLSRAVNTAGMRALGSPHVYNIHKELIKQGLEPNPSEPEGVSGVVVLSTSHAAIHTWPHRKFAYFDLFSCCNFDQRPVEDLIVQMFGPSDYVAKDLSFSLWLDGERKLSSEAAGVLEAVKRWSSTDNLIYKRLKRILEDR